MRVDLTKWMPHDKSMQVESSRFVGTCLQSLGSLKGYIIQIIIENLPVSTKVFATNEEALAIENEIWEAMQGGAIGTLIEVKGSRNDY